jgi:hypothetical protein
MTEVVLSSCSSCMSSPHAARLIHH